MAKELAGARHALFDKIWNKPRPVMHDTMRYDVRTYDNGGRCNGKRYDRSADECRIEIIHAHEAGETIFIYER